MLPKIGLYQKRLAKKIRATKKIWGKIWKEIKRFGKEIKRFGHP